MHRPLSWLPLLLAACSGPSDKEDVTDDTDVVVDSDTTNDTDAGGDTDVAGDTDVTADGALRVVVRDLEGRPIVGASVAVEGSVVSGATGVDGIATLLGIGASGVRLLVVEAEGFGAGFALVDLGSATSGAVVLAPMAVEALSDASAGGDVVADALTLSFPAGAVVDGQGNPVEGPVDVEVSVLGAGGDLLAVPPLDSVDGGGRLAAATSFQVDLSVGGVPVNVNEPVAVTLDLDAEDPVFAMTDPALYTFDEADGVWTWVGDVTVDVANHRVTATAPHFTWFSIASPVDAAFVGCARGTLTVAGTGAPIAGATVVATTDPSVTFGVAGIVSTTVTGRNGSFCVEARTGVSAHVSWFGTSTDGSTTYSGSVDSAVISTAGGQVCGGTCSDLGTLTSAGTPRAVDADHDGHAPPADCDDLDATVHPGATEVPLDGIDQDCDGTVDQAVCGNFVVDAGEQCDDGNVISGDGCDASCVLEAASDVDLDGYPAPADCDDLDATVHPGAIEVLNLLDDDCDGLVDEGLCGNGAIDAGEQCDDGNGIAGDGCESDCTLTGGGVYDMDGDGFDVSVDCDDLDASVNPGVAEIYPNGIDDNCNGQVDEGGGPVDYDGDGFDAALDCDDHDTAVHPGAFDVPGDGLDQDCDGHDAGGPPVCGNGSVEGTEACDDGNAIPGDGCDPNCLPTGCGNGFVTTGEECDDFNTVDGDGCDASCHLEDRDGDGFNFAVDCNDGDPSVHPAAAEIPNGIDDNCDGRIDEVPSPIDADGDGYPASVDCDDANAMVNPGAIELCGDMLDNDCNASIDDGCP